VITAVNGKEVTSMEEVVALINEAKVGDEVDLTLDRDGESKDVTVTLGERPDDASGSPDDSSGAQPDQGSPGETPQLPPGFGQ